MPPNNTEDKPANFGDKAINFCRESWQETIYAINDDNRGLWKENRKARAQVLFVAVVAGIIFAILFYLFFNGWGECYPHLFSSLILLILSLPTLATLWIFRTYDTREQIQKTQENINASLLSNGINMLVSDILKSRCVGLLQLAQLRQQGLLIKQIDLATAHTDFSAEEKKKDANGNPNKANFPKANLSGVDLSGADLSGANLSGADLSSAKLQGANLSIAIFKVENNKKALSTDLSGANLSGANLSNAKLRRADLRRADLRGADLSGAILTSADLSGAILTGAKYNDKTKLPDDDFSPKERGMEWDKT